MSQIDWSKAPEDATHHGRGEDCCYWAKCIGDRQYFINIARWDSGRWKEVTERYDVDFLTSRPKSEWTGEGLPPVGTVCEYRLLPSNQWHECEIRYHMTPAHDDESRAIVWNPDLKFDQISGSNWEFRPIRTPEQIAAENRTAAIREMMQDCPYAGSRTTEIDCASLYDAGYRKLEIVENEE